MKNRLFPESISQLDRMSADSIERNLRRLADLLLDRHVSTEHRRKVMSQVDVYLSKKCRELDSLGSGSPRVDLRRARNELAHGKSAPSSDYSYLYPKLWKAIAELGVVLGSSEIENLIAYTLNVPNIKLSSRSDELAKIVKTYRGIFDAFPAGERRILFRNILLGVFTDSRSLSILEGNRA